MRHRADGEENADRSEQPGRIPISERLCKPIRVEWIFESLEAVWKEPGRKSIRRYENDADQRTRSCGRPVSTPEYECDRQCDGGIYEHPLDLAHGRRGRDRPDGGQGDPHAEGTHERRERNT
jgi:hypothetical protein